MSASIVHITEAFIPPMCERRWGNISIPAGKSGVVACFPETLAWLVMDVTGQTHLGQM